ncbi:hypothetical protein K461DRAFT_264816 [Myriangium duriaei CBS 260.36]|uniref:Uncharacterized protein n=1 Tax=Myriangium duriaei CBS 260.36 TaxID=1168546 RepID=A0A9P4JAI9_9PEZI|nr:hypothetical protein K461DRAFT_264816 [Myriangium duriaei CBS 260.36]
MLRFTEILLLSLPCITFINAQSITSSSGGYAGYDLKVTGDPDSTLYETDETDTSANTTSAADVAPPDVYLNASVHVGEIDINVQNLAAKINLDAQVLSLLNFSAGVSASIDSVNLQIQNVTAKVLLEARLGNLVTMIDDVLDSIDVNPLIATLGQSVGEIGQGVGSALGGGSSTSSAASSSPTSGSNKTARSVELNDNILYSVNDYSGNTHRNRVLEQDGSIVDEYLDNDGNVKSRTTVGSYSTEFSPTGEAHTSTVNGEAVTSQEYMYNPYFGLNVVAIISSNAQNEVVAARVISEVFAGGMSSIHD